MRTRAVVYKEYSAKVAEQKGILDKGDALSAEDVTKAEALEVEIDALDAELKQIKKAQDLSLKNAQRDEQDETGVSGRPSVGANTAAKNAATALPVLAVRSNVRSFKGTKQEAALKAYQFGMFCMAALTQNSKAVQYCKENGIALKRQSEGDNSAGGFAVPAQFENDLIDLREEFGTFRAHAKNVPMTSDTVSRPRRTGGLTAYPVGEGKAAAESRKGWDRVELTAKKAMVLARYSSELDEDSIIDIGDDLAQEIAYAFAVFEDDCGWNGDGTGDFMRITGVGQTLLDVDATVANVKGIIVGSGDTWDELTLTDFHKVKARLPRYARRKQGSVAWHCSQAFYSGVMERLMLASGGVTAAELAAGRNQEYFMGYPVEISQSLPDTTAVAEIACYFGALDLAAMFGDRRQTTIAMSTDVFFEEDEIAVRGTERFDINVHDVGDTAKAGPIVALRTAAA